MSKIKDPIVYLDRVAREKEINLRERGVNKRSFEVNNRRYQYEPNGQRVRLRTYAIIPGPDATTDLLSVETVDVECIVELWSPK